MSSQAVGHGPPGPAKKRSTAELAGDLARETTSLVHHELDLAKLELAGKAKKAGLGGGALGGAGLAGVAALATGTICVIAAIHLVLPVWLAALIVTAAYAGAAGGLLVLARREVRQMAPPVPQETIESVKEDVAWLKKQAKSAHR